MGMIRLFLLGLLGLTPWMGHAEVGTLSFGVLNQQSLQLSYERWNPILNHVADKTGVVLRLRMGPTVQDTDAMMGRGEFDFMFTNHNFQREYDKQGYQVIARLGGEPIRCAFVVAPDSDITQLKALYGKRVAYPSADAFVAYAVPKVILGGQGVREAEVFAGNQDAALTQLRFRRVDAAAVNSRFLRQYEARHGVRFRVLQESEPYPELAVIVHPRVPAESREKVRAALLGMGRDAAGAALLAKAGFSGFEPASNADYEGVRRVYQSIGQ